MKKIFIFFAVLLGPTLAFGQETVVKRNTFYCEAFGQSLYNSFSYDRLYRADKKIKTSMTTGLTLAFFKDLYIVGSPISYNFLFGQKNHHLELGVGFTVLRLHWDNMNYSEGYYDDQGTQQWNSYSNASQTDYYSFFTPKIGYRFQKPNGGMFFRVTLTPPIAGINRIGPVNESKYYRNPKYEYFTSAAFFGYKVFPMAGVSVGYTLK